MAVYLEKRKGRNGGVTGVWIAEVTHVGVRVRKRFPTKIEADRWADSVKATGAVPAEAAPEDRGPTVAEVLELARAAGGPDGRWLRGRDPTLEPRLLFALEVLGPDTPINDVKTAHYDQIVAIRKRRKNSPGTINRYLTAASALLSFARKRDLLRAAPPAVPWQHEEGRRRHWLDQDGEQAVVGVMSSWGRGDCALTLRVLCETGVRWSEFEALEPANVAGEWLKLDSTKTDTPRDVPISQALGAELVRALEAKSLPRYQVFRKYLRRALIAAGQSPQITVHSLRHSTATRLSVAGVSTRDIMDYLGHRSVATTMRYAKSTPTSLQEARKKISQHAGQSSAGLQDPALDASTKSAGKSSGGEDGIRTHDTALDRITV